MPGKSGRISILLCFKRIEAMKKRRFRPSVVHHIYQKPIDGIVFLHTVRDFLVFLTIFFQVKKKHRVRILSVCPMVDHLHVVLEADMKEEMSAFVQEYTSKYVKEYNLSLDRPSGRLFPHRFGCAPKRDDKKARSTIAYSYNNAPERKLCNRAIEYQWNLLAYASSDHPFSDPIDLPHRSERMRKSMSTVRAFHRNACYLTYATLGRVFKGLSEKEVLQLIDYIISTYCDVDFNRAIYYFGSFEKMILAIDSNTGSEHDMKEEWVGYTDKVYAKMGRILQEKTGEKDLKRILKLPENKRRELYFYLLMQTDFIERQIEKYLQLPDSTGKRR